MVVKVVPLPAQQGIKFDLILDTGHVATIELTDYELRAYRASIAEVIEIKVLDWLEQFEYNTASVQIIFC